MTRLSRIRFFVLAFLAFTSVVWASAPFPAVGATTSENGRFLVAMQFEYLNPDQQFRTITRVIYRVLRREEFINDKFITANPFWSDTWSVSMAPKGIPPLPFVSNDGMYLVLVSVDPPFADITVLRIYRQRYGGEDLLGTYKLKDIWSADELNAHATQTSTGRPQWFAGSTLGFSADNRAFVVRTPWGRELRLDLNGGAIYAQ